MCGVSFKSPPRSCTFLHLVIGFYLVVFSKNKLLIEKDDVVLLLQWKEIASGIVNVECISIANFNEFHGSINQGKMYRKCTVIRCLTI